MRKIIIALILGILIGTCNFVYVLKAVGQTKEAEPKAGPPKQGFTYEEFIKAFKESGRKANTSGKTFNLIQERKKKALKEIEVYLKAKMGKVDPIVMNAFEEVPREYFQYHYADNQSLANLAYEENAKPWAIGYGSALSDYLGQAYMTQISRPAPDSVVLEIGTGSGFQAAVLSRIVKEVYSIEIIDPLGKAVGRIFKPLHYDNVETRVGDGFFGWPEVKEGFDIIIVTCMAQYVPPPLFEQLKPGGRLVIPVGQPFKKGQFLYVYTKDQNGKIRSRKDVGVFFVPMTGEQMKGHGR